MIRYEILLLAVPHITQEEEKNLEKGLDALVRQYKGSIISVDRWGKCRLAYSILKNDYGVYILVRFELEKVEQELLAEIKQLLAVKYNEIIMRHTVVRLAPGQKLEYKRPLSVEETPTRNVDSFMRENKMEGLISLDEESAMDRNETADDKFEEATAS
jgi:small subunit ribosomal protein S6